MEDFFDLDQTKAFVFLRSAEDHSNKVLVSDDKMLVFYKKKRKTHPLANIRELRSERIKLLFPLIVGGTLAPFSFLSFAIDPYYPWVHLVLILAGLFLFYLGWFGRHSFTIIFNNGDELQHHLPEISHHLESFIEFVNTQIANQKSYHMPLSGYLFFELDKNDERALFTDGKQQPGLFPLYGYTYKQLITLGKSPDGAEIITIDPLKAGREVKFAYEPTSEQMRPVLDGSISAMAVVKLHFYSKK